MAGHPLRQVNRVLWVTFFFNLVVAGAKLTYGYFTHTLSMTSDGYHSLLDASSNIIGFLTIWLGLKPPDLGHPYGHRKYEALGAMGISFLLFFACYEIALQAWMRFHQHQEPHVTLFSFLIMLFCMGVNWGVSHYEGKKAAEYASQILSADSAHTRSDFFASLSVLISLVAIKLGFSILDVIATLVIVIFIGRAAIKIIMDSLNALTDHAQLDTKVIRRLALSVEGVRECHDIRTRGDAQNIYMDFNIHVDPKLSTQVAHTLSHAVINRIKKEFPQVVDVVIHTEPINHEDCGK